MVDMKKEEIFQLTELSINGKTTITEIIVGIYIFFEYALKEDEETFD